MDSHDQAQPQHTHNHAILKRPARFHPGQVVITPGALDAFITAREAFDPYLQRHERGDWGDLDADDRRANEAALVHGTRLLSAYTLGNCTKVWVITDADRWTNTVLGPKEY